MDIAKEISNFVTQEFDTQRYKDFVSYVFSKKFEFSTENFEPKEKFTYIKKEYCLLPEALDLGNFQTLQFYVFEVDSVNAKVGLHKELKERLRNIGGSAILACFYQKGNPTFRLSLITRSLNEQEEIDYSNPKRQSFVLGNNNKTALLNFTKLVENIEKSLNPIEALTQTFSIENVTKEFYNEIVESFEEFANEIKFPTKQEDAHTRQFILRMFSRILFCKFLEKKEVIPSKLWDTNLSENYYHDVLEPLFFGTLNTEKDKRNYSLISEEIQELLRNIPYLNGGLFAPQEGDFFDSKNPTAHINTLKIPNQLFKDFFAMLDTFHFTIDESTPLDQEVGLDPEMLGMIFESLLSVLFTDNKVDKLNSLRKKTGSYYTPREIVSYMVKSSILEYLTDKTNLDKTQLKTLVFDYFSSFEGKEALDIMKALLEFKVLDPACGSGAFPMGMLQEICSILEALDPQAKAFFNIQSSSFKEENEGKDPTYIRKLSILQNNIYGVDIQPMAIEISRLRCFLSLICEEDKDYIAPLPNLEFKFVSANSLIPMPKNDNILIHDAYSTIRKVMRKYFNSSDKEKLQKQYREAQKIIAKNYEFSPLAEYDPFNPQSVAGFFDSEIMFEIKEFDVVIGNPPYIDYRNINEITKKNLMLTSDIYKKSKESSIFVYFIERGTKLIKKNGLINFINPIAYLCKSTDKGIRDFIDENLKLTTMIDVSNIKIFSSASTYTCINIFCLKGKQNNETFFSLCGNIKEFSQIKLKFLKIPQTKIENFSQYLNPITQKIAQNHFQYLGELCEIFCGLSKTGFRKDVTQIKSNKKVAFLEASDIYRYSYKEGKFLSNYQIYFSDKKRMIFENQELIFMARMTNTIRCCVTKNIYYGGKVNILHNFKNNRHLLLGILNSKFMTYFYEKKYFASHMQGGAFGFDTMSVEKLPIPQITESNQSIANKIIALVEEILEQKEQNPISPTQELEKEIDSLVYTLYTLTDDEIKIIENKE
ncbi:Eco57I restriction-modification methylase domain-containing protein [Helicobacter sp. faydin-H20]|uniref:Eco57I restriction-modification methylase domain-containing protein n=1 Tax=Helicobacter anatolicus TaxID=2905874 RepID=UPI001E5C442E|nr:Eco57I restriction-modification methylase domain-containing protein [Helicobacter anatolicus]MCE3037143.1 Eco57I restriction-modification methylase domain-containing protein [Helicobacter anatolicus]